MLELIRRKIRPDIRPASAAHLTNEPPLDIAQSHIVRPAIGRRCHRMAAAIVAAKMTTDRTPDARISPNGVGEQFVPGHFIGKQLERCDWTHQRGWPGCLIVA